MGGQKRQNKCENVKIVRNMRTISYRILAMIGSGEVKQRQNSETLNCDKHVKFVTKRQNGVDS